MYRSNRLRKNAAVQWCSVRTCGCNRLFIDFYSHTLPNTVDCLIKSKKLKYVLSVCSVYLSVALFSFEQQSMQLLIDGLGESKQECDKMCNITPWILFHNRLCSHILEGKYRYNCMNIAFVVTMTFFGSLSHKCLNQRCPTSNLLHISWNSTFY